MCNLHTQYPVPSTQYPYFSPFLKSLTLLLLLFAGFSCENEDTTMLPAEEVVEREWQGVPDILRTEQSAAYKSAGKAFRDTYYGLEIAAANDNLIITNPEGYNNVDAHLVTQLEASVGNHQMEEADLTALHSLKIFLETTSTPDHYTEASLRNYFGQYRNQYGVSLTTTPYTFQALAIIEEAIHTTQLDELRSKKEQIVDTEQKRGEDDKYCDVYGSLCPAGSNADQTLATAARIAVAAAAAQAFKDQITININPNGVGILGQNGLGNAAEAVLAAAVGYVIVQVWNTVFCSRECDECYPALGIDRVADPCDFIGIRPRGSFEFAERFTYLIDANMDGTFELPVLSLNPDGFVPASDLPTSTFIAIVDVHCDGNTIFPWSVTNDNGQPVGIEIDPNSPINYPLPSAFIAGPPLQGGSLLGYYRPNTQLCFTYSSLLTVGWTFSNWQASGGTPNQGPPNAQFCTQFNLPPGQTFSSPGEVEMNFTHPCRGPYRLSSDVFEICPVGGACL